MSQVPSRHLQAVNMNPAEFKKEGVDLLQYIIEFQEGLRDQRVAPTLGGEEGIKPGFLSERLPKEAPKQPEGWNQIMEDFQDKLLDGVSIRSDLRLKS